MTCDSSYSVDRRAQEEDYFNASDDEENAQPSGSSISSSVAVKRKREEGVDPQAERSNKRVHTKQNSSPRAGHGLGLDYGDDSDSDTDVEHRESPEQRGRSNTQSPIGGGLAPSPMPAAEESSAESPSRRLKLKVQTTGLASPAEDLGEMATKMSKKRMREADEDEGGLADLMSGGRPGTPRTGRMEEVHGARDRLTGLGSSMKDAGRKIKLNLGFGKKPPAAVEGDKRT